ncbi:hypothetical protein DSLASN_40750 [Desulfoluna limicola]|uniref:Metallo-beta-lactamase domain-containing protein n=1 Tax=Desulfoluna limicola TaxID=2810562 RepID=A0ABM7PLM6_9BACT|nr:MBL fold metallo-hydrolase [Desulfoluna limicola]BCS98443.1 hypothetical protein DSLASN_40750 [Desulfoluna limicola]
MPYLMLFLGLVIVGLPALLKYKLAKGIRRQQMEDSAFKAPKLDTSRSVATLSILPLVDYHATEGSLATEAGVSYLVEADGKRLLLDVGANEQGDHPSPLLSNAQTLGVNLGNLDALFLSHLHRDHVGGIEEEKEKRFSFSKGPHPCQDLPVYSPKPLTGQLPDGCKAVTVTEPLEIAPGIWSMGPMGRSLFLMGYTVEHALAIHVKNKGMALVIGCGHPSIERLIARCQSLFPHPVFAVIGGLHYPIHGGRMMLGPVNLQKLVGTDRMPWNGLTETDVHKGIAAIKKAGAIEVGLSPHDSCDWTLGQFREAFGNAYHEVEVGTVIKLGA